MAKNEVIIMANLNKAKEPAKSIVNIIQQYIQYIKAAHAKYLSLNDSSEKLEIKKDVYKQTLDNLKNIKNSLKEYHKVGKVHTKLNFSKLTDNYKEYTDYLTRFVPSLSKNRNFVLNCRKLKSISQAEKALSNEDFKVAFNNLKIDFFAFASCYDNFMKPPREAKRQRLRYNLIVSINKLQTSLKNFESNNFKFEPINTATGTESAEIYNSIATEHLKFIKETLKICKKIIINPKNLPNTIPKEYTNGQLVMFSRSKPFYGRGDYLKNAKDDLATPKQALEKAMESVYEKAPEVVYEKGKRDAYLISYIKAATDELKTAINNGTFEADAKPIYTAFWFLLDDRKIRKNCWELSKYFKNGAYNAYFRTFFRYGS